MANLNRRRSSTVSIRFDITPDYIDRELASKKNKSFQIAAARMIRHEFYIPHVDDYYKQMIESIIDTFENTAEGSESITARFYDREGEVGRANWAALSRPYFRRKRGDSFLHNKGGLESDFDRLFPIPSGTAIKPRAAVKVSPKKGRVFRAEVSVYIAHKLGHPELTRYVNKAFTRGSTDGTNFRARVGSNLFKLIAFEKGRKVRGRKGRVAGRPFIRNIAIAIGVNMRRDNFRNRTF